MEHRSPTADAENDFVVVVGRNRRDVSKSGRAHDDSAQPLRYTFFDDVDGERGIPPLCRVFKDYYAAEPSRLSRWRGPGDRGDAVSDSETRYVYRYLKDPRFTSRTLLSSRETDHVVYGIFAFVLRWPDSALLRFGREYDRVADLAQRLARDRGDGTILEYRGCPVNPRIFRIISWHFDRDLAAAAGAPQPPLPFFSLSAYVSERWVSHYRSVYCALQTERWTPEYLAHVADACSELGVPFGDLVDHHRARTPAERSLRPKYVTGVACCGKTTLLSDLHRRGGWTIESRRKLGTFAGKSRAPAYVAALHAAMDHAYRAGSGYVIGDRGPIDNPLWTAIMQLCDTRYEHTMVANLLQFFDHTFNELVVRYHGGFDVVVFLDPYPSRNRERMLRRCENGDAHRARLRQYVPAQFMAYYVFATLFGFKILMVPYTADGALDAEQHRRNGRCLEEYYGRASDAAPAVDRVVVSQVKNDVPDFMKDTGFPVVHGIFK